METFEILNGFRDIVDLLRYHVACGRFSFIDRINAAMDIKVVEETIREARRAVIGIEPTVVEGYRIKFEKGRVSFEKQVTKIACYECRELKEKDVLSGKISDRIWLHGTVIKTKDKKFLVCFTPPRTPSEINIAKFIDLASKDLSIAKKVAYLALFKSEGR